MAECTRGAFSAFCLRRAAPHPLFAVGRKNGKVETGEKAEITRQKRTWKSKDESEGAKQKTKGKVETKRQ